MNDKDYCNIPWKADGREPDGLDCVGLVLLWLNQERGAGFNLATTHTAAPEFPAGFAFDAAKLQRGDVVFFANASGHLRHVAIYLGEDKYLHSLAGYRSRIERGLTLLRRSGLVPRFAVPPTEKELLNRLLATPKLGLSIVVGIIISAVLSLAAAFLAPRPKLPNIKNETGRYGFDQLYTQISSSMPLCEVLGAVGIAGNSPFQTLIDRYAGITDVTQQKTNRVVILASGPVDTFNYNSLFTRINNIPYPIGSTFFYNTTTGTVGMKADPAQTKAEAVDGTIGPDVNRPSLSFYKGTHGITVPVDIRASYDRAFPVYGFSGCAYLVFRLIDSNNYNGFSILETLAGRKCRQFTAAGFTVTTVASESLTGADGSKVRFKLAYDDIKEITSLTVNGTSYSEISASVQTGNVYQLNKLKGFVEFTTAPAAAATVTIAYKYYPRAWTQNPVAQIIYLLTEHRRGKGFDESKIDWPAATDAKNYCDATVTWVNNNGSVSGARFTANYALDYRKSLQEHLQPLLDSFYGYLFLSNGKVIIKPRKADPVVADFDETNIIAGSFSCEQIDAGSQANRINLFYHGRESLNSETGVKVEDVAAQRRRAVYAADEGVVERNLKIPAIDNQVAAERVATILLNEEQTRSWVVQFKVGIGGIAIEPGDIITISPTAKPDWVEKKFRVEDFSLDADDLITIRASEYSAASYV